MEKTIEDATNAGYVESLWGKRRYIPELQSPSRRAGRGLLDHWSANWAGTVIQWLDLDHAGVRRKESARP